MKTIDSLIDEFESLVASVGVEAIDLQSLVDRRQAQSGQLASDQVVELLRVWLEHRSDRGLSATKQDALNQFSSLTFSHEQEALLEFEQLRLEHESTPSSIASSEYRSVRQLPTTPSLWGEFQLLSVLGEGAFARVYLARQQGMAQRLVALKLTHRETAESNYLAKLQHSAIVPIYSVHRLNNVTGVCMPYLGNTTLDDLLREVKACNNQKNAITALGGNDLLSILSNRQSRISTVIGCSSLDTESSDDANSEQVLTPPTLPPEVNPVTLATNAVVQVDFETVAERQWMHRQSSIETLRQLSYAEAIAWIAAQLADALAHAHRHGILHLDIKPANILLAADGQPRLLDFNVSLRTEAGSLSSLPPQRDTAPQQRLGGTVPYMSPEHLAAIRETHPQPIIDERSDIYSLGVMLYELLSGELPSKNSRKPKHTPVDWAKSLRQLNPLVTPALAAVVGKCLKENPSDRYPSCDFLYEDLHAHCQHQPLKHQRDPSVSERLRKWIRRHPVVSSTTFVVSASTLLLVFAMGAYFVRGKALRKMEVAHQWNQFYTELPEAITLASASQGYPDLLEAAKQSSLEVLRKRSQLLQINPDEFERQIPTQMAALLRIADSILISNSAKATDKDAALVDAELRRLIQQISSVPEYAEILRHSTEDPVSSFLQHDFRETLRRGHRVVAERGSDYAMWMIMGQSYLKLENWQGAQDCFTVCVTLRSDIAVGWFYRGISRLKAERFLEARDDFLNALTMDPHFHSARYNCALAMRKLNDVDAAVQQLDAAIQDGWQTVVGYAMRAELNRKLGWKELADADFQAALQCRPQSELDWIKRAMLKMQHDPIAAEADLQQALLMNPQSLIAMQNLAHLYSEQLPELEKAIEQLDALIKWSPELAQNWAQRAVVYARNGKLKEALGDLNRASSIFSKKDTPIVAYQIACGYSLVAGHLEQPEKPVTDGHDDFPTTIQLADIALRWYKSSIRIDPSLVQLSQSDNDFAWLRMHAGYAEANDAITRLQNN